MGFNSGFKGLKTVVGLLVLVIQPALTYERTHLKVTASTL